MIPSPEPIERAVQAGVDSVARRRVATIVIVTLGALVVVTLAVQVLGVVLLYNAQQERNRGEKTGQKIIADLYDSINRTDRNLAKLTGQPAPPPITPPPQARTTRSTVSAPTTNRAVTPGSTSTTSEVPRPTSTTTTTTTRPPPSSTTTTTQPGPCVTASIVRVGC